MKQIRSERRRRFDLIEVAGIAVLCAMSGAVALERYQDRHPPSFGEGERRSLQSELAQRYGPSRNSQFDEEWIVRDFFQDRRGGTFVDIGAADYRENSNTYALERELGWSGIAVDALAPFAEGYRRNRPATKFFVAFVSDTSNDEARLYVNDQATAVSSSNAEFTQTQTGRPPASITVPTVTLDDLLQTSRIERFDFLSLDIELAEPKALRGFSIDRYRPALVCVEAHPEVRQWLLNYFAEHRYVVVGRYLHVDSLNLWFQPLPGRS